MGKIPNLKISSGYTCVDNAQGLARLTKILHGAVRVSMDTEADSLHHYYEKVCLIQLSFLGENYIIDPLVGFSLSEFFEVLSQKELIFHGADFDLRVLKKSFGFRPKAPIFDTIENVEACFLWLLRRPKTKERERAAHRPRTTHPEC